MIPLSSASVDPSARTHHQASTEARSTPSAILSVTNLTKRYHTARGELTLFEGLNLTVHAGEMVAIVGHSGSGKSTLLHMLGALDAPSGGGIYCASTDVVALGIHQAAQFRGRKIGYLWQFHYLLPEFSALENVALPLLGRGETHRHALGEAARWLREVGLEDRGDHRPGELSGGEQQRVALARALVTEPEVLLADEPTGDLDDGTAEKVFGLIERLHAEHGLTSVIVTHNMELAGRCSRVLHLEGGKLMEEGGELSR